MILTKSIKSQEPAACFVDCMLGCWFALFGCLLGSFLVCVAGLFTWFNACLLYWVDYMVHEVVCVAELIAWFIGGLRCCVECMLHEIVCVAELITRFIGGLLRWVHNMVHWWLASLSWLRSSLTICFIELIAWLAAGLIDGLISLHGWMVTLNLFSPSTPTGSDGDSQSDVLWDSTWRDRMCSGPTKTNFHKVSIQRKRERGR